MSDINDQIAVSEAPQTTATAPGFEGLRSRGSFSTGETPPAQTTATPTEKVANVETAGDTGSTTTETPPTTTVDPYAEYRRTLGQKLGLQVETDDQIIENWNKYKGYEQELAALKNKNPYEGLDPLAIDIDKAKKAGIDINLFLDAREMEIEKLEKKEALHKMFLLENPELDRKTASILFEDEYETKYGILGQKMDEAEAEVNAKKLEVAKARLEAEAVKAKRFLGDWKTKHVTIPPPQQSAAPENQAALRQAYENQVESFINERDTIEIPVGDKIFKYGLDEHKEAIHEGLKNPVDALRELFGVDVNKGTVDAEMFGSALAALYSIGTIGKQLAEFSVEQFNQQVVTSKTQTTAPPQKMTGGVPPERSHDEKLADAFVAERAKQRSSGY